MVSWVPVSNSIAVWITSVPEGSECTCIGAYGFTWWRRDSLSPPLIIFAENQLRLRQKEENTEGEIGRSERPHTNKHSTSTLSFKWSWKCTRPIQKDYYCFLPARYLLQVVISSLLTLSVSAWGTPLLRATALLTFGQNCDAFCPLSMIKSSPPLAWRRVTDNHVTIETAWISPMFVHLL